MTNPHPHWLRTAIIAGVGLLVAIVSILWVSIYLRSVGPETLSLAYRIDSTKTLAFARTGDEESLLRAMRRLQNIFGENSVPDPKGLPKGTTYEYALLTGSGSKKEWIIGVHLRNQEEKLMASVPESSLLLPHTQIKQSLGASTFFRAYEKNAHRTLSYVDLEKIAILTRSGSGLLGAGLRPFASALLLERNETEHEWIFERKQRSSSLRNLPLLPLLPKSETPLFALSISDPLHSFLTMSGTLSIYSPSLQEGIIGILQKHLEQLTHRTDLQKALHELFRNGMRMTVSEEKGKSHFLIEGSAVSTQALTEWSELVRSAATPTLIRTQTFLHGNSRTDVTVNSDGATVRKVNGWEQISIGSGSEMPLLIATKGRSFLVTDDEELLQTTLAQKDSVPSSPENGLFGALIDVGWLRNKLGRSFLLTQEERTLLESILPAHAKSILFHALDGRDSVIVKTWMNR